MSLWERFIEMFVGKVFLFAHSLVNDVNNGDHALFDSVIIRLTPLTLDPSIYSFFIADMGSSTGHPLSEIILEFLLHHLRWIPVCFILLPLSFIYDLITRARNRLVHYVCFIISFLPLL